MKRKTLRKLGLHRETVRHLQAADLIEAVGGANTHELNTGCACTVGCGGTGGGTGGATGGCATGGCASNTHEFISGCATNCG